MPTSFMQGKPARRIYQNFEDLYGDIPKLECKKQCGMFCGPAMMSRYEATVMKRAMGVQKLPISTNGICPAYNQETKTCNYYEARPLFCRLWGVTRKTQCPRNCRPEKWLDDDLLKHLIRESVRLGGGMTYGFASPTWVKLHGLPTLITKKDFR